MLIGWRAANMSSGEEKKCALLPGSMDCSNAHITYRRRRWLR